MKSQIKIVLFLTLAIASLNACKKDPAAIKALIAESQIADLVESSLQESMAGLTEQLATALEIAQANASVQCGTTKDTTIIIEKTTVAGTADFETDYSWTLECAADVTPLNFDFTCHSEGIYDNNRMSSSGFGDANWVLTGLDESVEVFTANGNYSRNGEQVAKTVGILMETNMDIVVSNLEIDKVTEEITGGSAEVTVSGTPTGGESFNFEGQIVFKGNGKATLTVNGKKFNLSL